MTKYRIKAWVGCSGARYYAVEKRFLFFWYGIDGLATCDTVEQAKVAIKHIDEVYYITQPSDAQS